MVLVSAFPSSDGVKMIQGLGDYPVSQQPLFSHKRRKPQPLRQFQKVNKYIFLGTPLNSFF
jgi:hypothetical protein